MENSIGIRRVARDMVNSMLRNRIDQFEKLDVEFLVKKYALTLNPELGLYFIPDATRGRSALSLPNLPDNITNALTERDKADEYMTNCPCWFTMDKLVVKDRRKFILFKQVDGKTTATAMDATVKNKETIEKTLGKKLSSNTKYVIPLGTARMLYDMYRDKVKQ